MSDLNHGTKKTQSLCIKLTVSLSGIARQATAFDAGCISRIPEYLEFPGLIPGNLALNPATKSSTGTGCPDLNRTSAL